MRFLKKLFSKTALVFLAIVLQVVPLIILFYYFADISWQFQLAIQIIAIVLCLVIINRKENPEFKAPWLVVILLFPIFGIIIYFLFANYHTRPKEAKITKKVHLQIEKALQPEKDDNSSMNEFKGIGQYISGTLPFRGSNKNRVNFFPDGQSFFDEMIAELEKAKEFIFLEYFIIGYGAIWDRIHQVLRQKVKEGVEIRLIYDDIGSTFYLKNNFYKSLRKEGIKCYKFNSFHPFVSGIYNNRDHRKICIVDHTSAFTGGINIADEYANINSPFGYWKDTGIKVQGPAVKNFIAMFLATYDIASKTYTDYSHYFNYQYSEYNDGGFTLPFSDGPRPFYMEYIAENVIATMINEAKEKVFISTPYLIPTYHLMLTLRNAALRGIDVRIIVPGIPDKKMIYMMSKSNFKTLMDAGVKIYYYTPGFNHAKSIIVDDCLAFVGTINLDFRSLVHHYENGVILYQNPCVVDIANDFHAMLGESALVTKENFKFNALSRLVCSIFKLFTPLL